MSFLKERTSLYADKVDALKTTAASGRDKMKAEEGAAATGDDNHTLKSTAYFLIPPNLCRRRQIATELRIQNRLYIWSENGNRSLGGSSSVVR